MLRKEHAATRGDAALPQVARMADDFEVCISAFASLLSFRYAPYTGLLGSACCAQDRTAIRNLRFSAHKVDPVNVSFSSHKHTRILRLEGLKIQNPEEKLSVKELRRRERELENKLLDVFSSWGGEITYINLNVFKG